MKAFLFGAFLLFQTLLLADFTQTYKHPVKATQISEEFYFWKETKLEPFNELIFSWNGQRPEKGSYIFYISVKSGKWSKWMRYAEWSANDQKTFKSDWGDSFARNNTDVIAIKENQLADGFQVKVVAAKGANCKNLDALFAISSNLNRFNKSEVSKYNEPLQVHPIFPQSQMVLLHERHRDLCSPTSTTIAINSLLQQKLLDPIEFAAQSRDTFHDIYGNWILNTAEAYQFLSSDYYIYPKRLNSFEDVIDQLKKNIPVVVSVKGKIKGAPLAYKGGHLMTIVGWDPVKQHVLFIDSAHPSNESSVISYSFEEFNNAWSIRKNLCYFFEKKSTL